MDIIQRNVANALNGGPRKGKARRGAGRTPGSPQLRGVEILGYAPDGTDAAGNPRSLVRFRTSDGQEQQAHTSMRCSASTMLQGVASGTRANLVRDARGSIMVIERLGGAS